MRSIKELLFEWNPWWDREYHFSGIKRELFDKVKKWLKRKEIIAILGVRRAGKTTLLFETIDFLINEEKIPRENILFIKADDERVEKEDLINRTIDEYLKWKGPEGRVFIFIDEIQEIKDWQKTLKRIYDLEQEKKKIFISGSNSSLLKEELSYLLTGRFAYFELFPFSFKEFLIANKLKIKNETDLIKQKNVLRKFLIEYLSFGGFPEIVFEKDKEKKEELLRFYFDSIIYRDVIKRKNLRNAGKISKLIEWYLQNISSNINFTKIGKFLELTTDSVVEYTKYLEEAYLVFVINLFAYSLKKQFVNPKKIYCIDSGIRRIIGFVFSEDIGRIYENIVFIELKRRKKNIYYWKDKNECDFLIKEKNKIKQSIQVCYNLNKENKEREINGLLESINKFNLKEGLVITEDYEGEEKIKGKKIKFVPLWKWLLK